MDGKCCWFFQLFSFYPIPLLCQVGFDFEFLKNIISLSSLSSLYVFSKEKYMSYFKISFNHLFLSSLLFFLVLQLVIFQF